MTAETMFWISVGLVLYAYVGYPCLLSLIAALRQRPVQRGTINPRVTFVITAHNEESRIREKLDNTLRQNYPADQLEIIVASDCSTDRTDDIVRSYSPRVWLVRARERRGKEAAQQLAVRAALGEILIFSDVATALAPDAVSTIVENFADPTVGCVTSVDRFVDADGRPSGEGAYVRYEMWLRRLESRANTVVSLSGSFFAARRDVCSRWVPDQQSDFRTLLNAVYLGYRGVLDVRSIGFYRNIANDRREFPRKVRTVVRGLSVLGANVGMMNPMRFGLFAWQLASHKLCRWLVPFGLLGALIANLMLIGSSPFFELTLAGQAAFYAMAVAGWSTRAQALRIPTFFFAANLAVFTAWLRYARGERIVSWSPSERVSSLPEARRLQTSGGR